MADSGRPEPTVGDLMTRRPLVVWPDTAVGEVAEILELQQISAVPVVDWTGYLVGIVSQMDLLRVRASDGLWAQWSGLEARQVMSRPVLTVTADTSLGDAARRMEEHGVHRLVVVEDDGETPVGVLSATDVVRAIAEAHGDGREASSCVSGEGPLAPPER
jgi:CBS domain-containing protein